MEEATVRRERIMSILHSETGPVSASRLAELLHVSRQVIVGDIALLRAGGREISSTARGYRIPEKKSRPSCRIACCHTPQQMRDELYTIVDNGCQVVDVIVEHPIYEELIGRLSLHSRYEVDEFIDRCQTEQGRLLSELTCGVHLHTILYPNEKALKRVKEELAEKGYLYHTAAFSAV